MEEVPRLDGMVPMTTAPIEVRFWVREVPEIKIKVKGLDSY